MSLNDEIGIRHQNYVAWMTTDGFIAITEREATERRLAIQAQVGFPAMQEAFQELSRQVEALTVVVRELQNEMEKYNEH